MPTPAPIADEMVGLLFRDHAPRPESRVLDPGCGTGAFIQGIIRWCKANRRPLPQTVGIESEPTRAALARKAFKGHPQIEIRNRDFLTNPPEAFDFVIGNPPYVPITELTEKEKATYRSRFVTAVERFDLYLLFFEQALKCLNVGGRLVFITPEKFMYVSTAAALRRLLARVNVQEVRLIDESAFRDLVTYPTITVVSEEPPSSTRVTLRTGRTVSVDLPGDGSSWLSTILSTRARSGFVPLEEACIRISCGVATGADSVFVKESASMEKSVGRFAFPTISGRELTDQDKPRTRFAMLIPYDARGRLLPLGELDAFGAYLENPDVQRRLKARTCVSRKPWYSFHENPPMHDLLRPKLLCKDITAEPRFWIDADGSIVPRHSVYYLVPKNPKIIHDLARYLNSRPARMWLSANCQRAANGFLRLQSHVLKKLPIPPDLAAQSEHLSVRAGRQRATLRVRSPLLQRELDLADAR